MWIATGHTDMRGGMQEELEATATEDELAAEQSAAKTTTVRALTRRRAERDTFPDHLPRERVVIDPPTACGRCGGNRLRQIAAEPLNPAFDVLVGQFENLWRTHRSCTMGIADETLD